MADLQNFDLLLRTATVALAVATAVAILLRPDRNRAAGYAAFVVAGVGAFMIASAPGIYTAFAPGAFFFNAWCIATPAAVWLLARVLFRDEASPATPLHLMAIGALVAITVAGDYGRFRLGPMSVDPEAARWMLWAGRAGAVALLFAACAMAVMHWREDLIEQRRRVRAAFVAVFGTAFVALAGSEFVFGGRGAPIEVLIVGHSLLLALVFLLLQYLVRGGLSELLSDAPVRTAGAPLAIVRSDAGEAALAQRVVEAMSEGRLWKRDGLGIADLAEHLRTQEYRLRRAINCHLGYRNFNEFLHDYRLKEAAARLVDPDEQHLPVLTIALDCGYGSIGPFNRAFKVRFGLTPSQFRSLRNRPDFPPKSASLHHPS